MRVTYCMFNKYIPKYTIGSLLMSDDVKPWDMFNGTPRATKEEAERRFDICKACPQLVELTSTCKECGCFMYMKTKLEPATCPLGKW